MNRVPFMRADPAPTCDTKPPLLNDAPAAVLVTELVSRITTPIQSPLHNSEDANNTTPYTGR